MSEVLRVDFAAMQAASADIRTALGVLREQLAQVESDAAPLMSTWEGEARDAYLVRQGRWRRAADDLATILGDIGRALDESTADYAATERRNAGMFQ
jgi:early secretory antigenic target protein ESAT-6